MQPNSSTQPNSKYNYGMGLSNLNNNTEHNFFYTINRGNNPNYGNMMEKYKPSNTNSN